MPISMEDRLKNMKKQWKTAKSKHDQTFGGVKIDEGEYFGRLQKCGLAFDQTEDTKVNCEFLIKKGKFDGFVAYTSMNLDSDWGKVFAIRFVEMSGYEFDTDDPVKLIAIVKKIQDDKSLYKIECIHKDGYANIRINDCIEDEDDEIEHDAHPAKKSKKSTSSKGKISKNKTEEFDEEPEEEEEEEEELPFQNIEKMTRKELKFFIKDNEFDIRVMKSMSDKKIKAEIKAMLGTKQDPEQSEGKEKEIPTDVELKKQLLTFCKANGVKGVKKSMPLDDLIDEVEEYTFENLDEDEENLLNMLALGDCIQ